MDRIINLKNRASKAQSADSQGSFERELTIPASPLSPETSKSKSEARIISWSGQLHLTPNIPAIIVVSVIFFVIAVLVQIFQKNVITTFFFAMIGIIILLNSRHKPEIVRFEINPAGVQIDENTHHYGEIKSFWIEYDPTLGIQELSLQLKKWHAPYVKIPIYGQNPVQLRLALLEFLPEVEHKDSIVEIVSRKLGI